MKKAFTALILFGLISSLFSLSSSNSFVENASAQTDWPCSLGWHTDNVPPDGFSGTLEIQTGGSFKVTINNTDGAAYDYQVTITRTGTTPEKWVVWESSDIHSVYVTIPPDLVPKAGDYTIKATEWKGGTVEEECGGILRLKVTGEEIPQPDPDPDNCTIFWQGEGASGTVNVEPDEPAVVGLGGGKVSGDNYIIKANGQKVAESTVQTTFTIRFTEEATYTITGWHVKGGTEYKCSSSLTLVVTEDSGGGDVDPIPIPGLEAGEGKDVNVVASGFASTFLSFGIGIAGGIAFLLMVFGAYRLIFAGGNPDAMQQGKEIITAAIAGLLVIIFAVFILRFLGFTILGLGF